MKAEFMDCQLFKIWLEEKKNLSESSVDLYVKTIQKYIERNLDIDLLEDYNNYIIEKAIKKRCQYIYYVFRAFIEFKITDAKQKKELIEGLILPETPEDIKLKRRYLDEDILIEILNKLESKKHRVISIILMLTGVRIGDIMKLKRDNIIPEEYKGKSVLRLQLTGKRKKDNIVHIYDEVGQEIIVDYISNNFGFDTYYFIDLGTMTNRVGNVNSEYRLYKMNYLWFWTDLKQALEACGVNKKDFATHDFRRCFARRVWTKYKDFEVLKNLLNHKDPNTTMRYLRQSGLKNIDYHMEMQQ